VPGQRCARDKGCREQQHGHDAAPWDEPHRERQGWNSRRKEPQAPEVRNDPWRVRTVENDAAIGFERLRILPSDPAVDDGEPDHDHCKGQCALPELALLTS
jgi:hypothetical protein